MSSNATSSEGQGRSAVRLVPLLLALAGCAQGHVHRIATERGVVAGAERDAVERLAAALERHEPAVRERLGDALDGPVIVELGAAPLRPGVPGATSHGTPWRRARVLLAPDASDATLVHELVHALHGPSWRRLPGFVEEGLAEWLSFEITGDVTVRARRLRGACAPGGRSLRLSWKDGERVRSALSASVTPPPAEPASLAALLAFGQSGSWQRGHSYDVMHGYGVGFVLVERIAARGGVEALHRLCREAMRDGEAIVPAERVLAAADFASLAELEAFLEERRPAWLAHEALLDGEVSRIFGRSGVDLRDLSLADLLTLRPRLDVDGTVIELQRIEGFDAWWRSAARRETFVDLSSAGTHPPRAASRAAPIHTTSTAGIHAPWRLRRVDPRGVGADHARPGPGRRALMRSLLWIVLVALCVVGGPVLLLRGLEPVPELGELDERIGVVAEVGLGGGARDGEPGLTLRLADSPEVFEVPGWFPGIVELRTVLEPGDPVLLRVDAGRRDWIWQAERAAQVVVSYARVRETVAARRRIDAIVGGVLTLVALLGVWTMRPRRERPVVA